VFWIVCFLEYLLLFAGILMFVYGKFCSGIWSFNDSSRILKRIYIGLRYENGLLVGVLCVRSYIGGLVLT